MRAFRDLVAKISASPQTAGLTAVTSHETLLISPYTRYPDWFDGRHVRVTPLQDGRVQIARHPGQSNLGRAEVRRLPVEQALDTVLTFIAEL
jgi:hypothetical protein